MTQDTSRTSTTFRNLNFENAKRFEIKNLENLQNDAVVYSSFDNRNFYFNIPLIFEKKYFSIFEIAKKIQFIGIDSASFEENYKIPVLNKTLNNFYKYQKTNVKGIYVAGDITDNNLKQIITAGAEGAVAAYNIYQEIKRDSQK